LEKGDASQKQKYLLSLRPIKDRTRIRKLRHKKKRRRRERERETEIHSPPFFLPLFPTIFRWSYSTINTTDSGREREG
jgi:hypothetical protein